MKHLVVALAVLMAIVVGAAPATANVPSGNGLERIAGEILCVDESGAAETTLLIVGVRGAGATGWRAEPQGQHHVLSYFAITYHFDSGDVTDAKTWGNKTGLAPLRCHQEYPAFGAFPAVTIDGTIHPLPGN